MVGPWLNVTKGRMGQNCATHNCPGHPVTRTPVRRTPVGTNLVRQGWSPSGAEGEEREGMDIAAGQTMWLTNGKVVDVVSGEVHVGRNIENERWRNPVRPTVEKWTKPG